MDLSHKCIFESQVVTTVDEQLVLEVLRRMEVLAGRLFSVTPALSTQHNSY